ncbi:MAG: hypothetical protein N3C62_04570 [Synergistetes bacterium]|nr:hypothetical protein [Synergistota bacterium]MCX8127988.1 hypothetical protein [Synergistota bacterium]MDW8192817.1 hypothetical protein [Synergistota bacterium]
MSDLILILIIFSAVLTLQFFKGRKLNLILMKSYLEEIESVLRIKDKDYTWIGGYVGFKAGYKIENKLFSVLEVSLILSPRHSLLYLPISLLLFRGDRVFFLLTPRGKKVESEVHVIREGAFWFRPKIRRARELREKRISLSGVNFSTFCENEMVLDKVLRLIRKYRGDLKIIKHLALVPSTNRLYLHLRPKTGELKEFLRLVVEAMEI